ncbi:MAG: hypothetical protein PF487_02370 [Bacteroidales bacterium]|jgi:hypothetical protein|nr:hypothetical protein [Bacteroidales bacterium]
MRGKLFSSGDVFRDFGIIELSELVKDYSDLKTNYLEINSELTEDVLFKKVKEALIKRKELEFLNEFKKTKEYKTGASEEFILREKKKYLNTNLISFPFMRNSPKWGNLGGIKEHLKKQDKVYENIKLLISLFFSEQNKNHHEKYEYSDEICSICNQNNAPELDFTKARIVSSSLYPLTGGEKSDFANYGNESIKLCFSCEFLALLAYLNNITTSGSLFYSRNLILTKELNAIFKLNKNILTNEEILKKIMSFNKLNFNEFKFVFESNQFTPEYLNTYSAESLLIFYKTKRIIENFHFDGNKIKVKGEKILIQNLRSENYKYVQSVLLSHLIKKNETYSTIHNLQQYIKFLLITGGDMKNISTSDTWKSGKKLGIELLKGDRDGGKVTRLSLKLIQLMKANDRNTLLEEILHVLMVNKMEIPFKMTKQIIDGSENELHLYIGTFIEGLNNKSENTKNKGENDEEN